MAGRKPRPDLLDELIPTTGPTAATAAQETSPPPPAGAPERRAVIKIRESVAEQARAAVVFLQGHGQPAATLTAYVEDAVRDRLKRDRAELNDGEAFPPVVHQLRPGRRIGG
jgi:hypothetical protein